MDTSGNKRLVLVTPRALTKDPQRVTELLGGHGLTPVFGEPGVQPDSDQLSKLLPGCVGWIAGVEPIGADVLAHAPDLLVLSRFGIGTSNVDLRAARKHGIEVAVARGANAQSVAELALGLTLDCLRGITRSSATVPEGGWDRQMGREIGGLTAAVVGFGAIGRIYADLLHRLGATPVVYDPMLPDDAELPAGVLRAQTLPEAVSGADIVSFHCPPAEEPLFNSELLALCKEGLIVINTARSELVDDTAMLRGLQSGKISSYGVDAFDSEPPEPSDLLSHPHVIATPHLGAYTEEAITRTLDLAVANTVSALRSPSTLREQPLGGTLRENLEQSLPTGVLRFHWLGQAGFLIRVGDGPTIAIDPYLSDSLAEKYRGKVFPHQRMMEAPIDSESIPELSLILITHGHTDHMDPGTLPGLAEKHPNAIFVCPERVRATALERGVPAERLLGAVGEETLEPLTGVRVFPLPSAHENLDVTSEGSAYVGYVIEVGGEKIYHSGDCAPFEDLPTLLRQHSPSIALLPVNGRDQYRLDNGVPGNFTLQEALDLCEQVGIRTMVAHHWGMFEFNTIPQEELLEAWELYSGSTSWYIPSPLTFLERRPAFARDFNA